MGTMTNPTDRRAPSVPFRRTGFPFDRVVVICFGVEQIVIGNAQEALVLLKQRWPPERGPSYDRALKACQAYRENDGSMLAARAGLCVAAMEAGLAFETFPDQIAFLEAEIAAVTSMEVREERIICAEVDSDRNKK
jgi:hypothetical protein